MTRVSRQFSFLLTPFIDESDISSLNSLGELAKEVYAITCG
jgi:hypothetical protein